MHPKNLNKGRKKYSSLSSETESEDNVIREEAIYPGLILKDNYILLKKIGFGNNATVWMTYQISSKTYLAIKIQDYQCFKDGCREVNIIKRINSYCETNKLDIYCVKMLDYFIHEEEQDVKFVCSVYNLYAGSLQMLLNNGKYKYGLPIPIVKKITKQLLIAASTLHDELEIIHTDVKPDNILFKGITQGQNEIIDLFNESDFDKKYTELRFKYSKNKNRLSEEIDLLATECVVAINNLEYNACASEELEPDNENDEEGFIDGDDDDYDDCDNDKYNFIDDDNYIYNENRTQSIDDDIDQLNNKQIYNLDETTTYNYKTVLNNRENSTDRTEVIDDKYVLNCVTALTDYGNSYFYNRRTKNEIQDRRYRAPEVILDLNYGYGCDIWSVACVTFELLTGFCLFEPDNEPINRDIHHLYLLEKNLGEIPISMKKVSKRSRFLFDKKRNYHIKNIEPFNHVPLKKRLMDQFLFSKNDAEIINDFLSGALTYIPKKRATARELLAHPWLRDN